MTGSELHAHVTEALPEGAPLRGFTLAMLTVLKYIQQRGCWSFRQAKSQILLLDQYSTGTVAVTQDSGTVTGTGTVWTAGMVGRKFKAAGNEVYTITARASNTSITISPVYQGASASGLSYLIFQDTYDLPSDVSSVSGWWNATQQKWLTPVTPDAIGDLQNASNFTSNWPDRIAQFGTNAGVPQVIVWPAPSVRAMVPIIYTRQPTNPTGPGSTIDLPSKMDAVLVQGMVYFMMARLPKAYREQLSSGDLEHERNRFYSMLDKEWADDQAIVRGTEYAISNQAGAALSGFPVGWDPYISGPAIPA